MTTADLNCCFEVKARFLLELATPKAVSWCELHLRAILMPSLRATAVELGTRCRPYINDAQLHVLALTMQANKCMATLHSKTCLSKLLQLQRESKQFLLVGFDLTAPFIRNRKLCTQGKVYLVAKQGKSIAGNAS